MENCVKRAPNSIWKCFRCGLVMENLHPCTKDSECKINCPVCCGHPMTRMVENTDDTAAKEKHVPCVVEGKTGHVSVGCEHHPMSKEHYIEWVELISDSCVMRKYFHPDSKPEVCFGIELKPGMILRAYCNLHGLWSHKIK